MRTEAVRKNYSPVGASLIEKLYSEDYLSIGGTQSTDILADQAGVIEESSVLDVGSGLGGPALYLAATRGCRITGLDLVETNVLEARSRAKARGLEGLATFKAGDATDMPFENGTFDVVWGQDAWCHVPDKNKLIAECSRMLVPGGTIAFTDWLQTGDMNEVQRAAVYDATASSNMATMRGYCEMLEMSGFSILYQDDISTLFITQYRYVIAKLESLEPEISEQFNPKVYRIMLEKNGAILRAFEGDLIGGGRIIARRDRRTS